MEFEHKSMLSEEDYNKLLKFFSHKGKLQTNHYADTAEYSLDKLGITLRVRAKGESTILQMKVPKEGGKEELEESLSHEDYSDFLHRHNRFRYPAKFRIALHKVAGFKNMKDLKYLGVLTTDRRTIPAPNIKGEWALDKSTYPSGAVDYEIELEHGKGFEEDAQAILLNLLNEYRIEYRPSKLSKFQRFVQDIENHKENAS